MTEAKPRIAVVVFPGRTTTGTRRSRSSSSAPIRVLHWHADTRAAATWARSSCPAGSRTATICARRDRSLLAGDGAVADFAADGGPVLGICNGFQVLCEAGLLPGVLRPNESLSFVCEDVPLRVERAGVAFLTRCEPGQRPDDPHQARRGLLLRRRRAARRARRGGSDRPALRGQPERLGRHDRRRRQRRRQRHGPDAASRARRRPADRLRLHRRGADPRSARRPSPRAALRGCLAAGDSSTAPRRVMLSQPFAFAPSSSAGNPSVRASSGRPARLSTSRATSRARSVTGPRRAVPPVV